MRRINSLVVIAALCSAVTIVQAQSYTAVDLGPGLANSVSGGIIAGYSNVGGPSHAKLWDSAGFATDVHPAFLAGGTSAIVGCSGTTCVGYGSGTPTLNRQVAIMWSGGVPSLLSTPADTYYSRANATDGSQIVGQLNPNDTIRDFLVAGPSHAVIWDASTGTMIRDLYRGKPIIALGVRNGQQVGYEMRRAPEARLWEGTANSVVDLHPHGFDASQAVATDGARQVGSVSMDLQPFAEKRGRRVRFSYASVWSGSSASFSYLPAYPYGRSWATGISGDFISGYGYTTDRYGAVINQHALAWTGPFNDMVELHSLLPSQYTNSWATGVDDNGNISGYALGERELHAILWVRTP